MKIKNDEAGVLHVTQLALIGIVVGIVGVAGLRVHSINQAKQLNHAAEEHKAAEAETLPDNLDNILPVEEVKKLAANEKADSAVVHIELKFKDGKAVFEVTLADGTVLMFDAVTGAAQLVEPGEDKDEDGDVLPADFTFGISFSEARTIALQQYQGKIRKIEVEVESGVVVFSVRFVDDARVDVNAADGTVVRIKPADTDHDEDRSGSNSGGVDDDEVDSDEDVSGSDTPDDTDGDSGDDDSSGSSNSGSGSSDSGSSGSAN